MENKIIRRLKNNIRLIRVLWLKRYDKTNFILLKSDKFGHFYGNTDIFLREMEINEYNNIFVCKKQIDNEELFELWERLIGIYYGDLLILMKILTKILPQKYKFKVSKSRPQNITRFRERIGFAKLFSNEIGQCKNNLVGISVRDSTYQSINQKDRRGGSEEHRDSHVNQIKKIKEYLEKNEYSCHFYTKYNGGIENKDGKNYSLEEALKKGYKSKYFIMCGTGMDPFFVMNKKNMLWHSTVLGISFPTTLFTANSICIPLLFYSTLEERILTLREQIDVYQYLENKSSPMLSFKEQASLSLVPLFTSYHEIKSGWEELKSVTQTQSIREQWDDRQEKFWSIYPRKWFAKGTLVHDRSINEFCLISPSFLQKHEKNYLK